MAAKTWKPERKHNLTKNSISYEKERLLLAKAENLPLAKHT